MSRISLVWPRLGPALSWSIPQLCENLLRLLLDQRLRLDDRILFRKRVKRREKQAADARLGNHEAQRRDREAVSGLELVQDAALGAVRDQFVMHVEKMLLRQRLD